MRRENKFGEEQQLHREKFIFVGALAEETSPLEFEQRMFLDYQEAYYANVNYIVEQEGAIIIPARVTHRSTKEVNKFLSNWNTQNQFTYSVSYTDNDAQALLFPQDFFIVGEGNDYIVVHSKHAQMVSGYTHESTTIKNDKLAVGGSYVPGDEVVFSGLGKLNNEEEKIVSELLYPNRGVIPVSKPHDTGMRGYMNVASHIDQFIGGAMTLTDGAILVPINYEYFRKIKRSLPAETYDGRDIRYIPKSGTDLDFYYLFNYPRTPNGTFYIGPVLARWLDEKGLLSQIESPYHILPAEMPTYHHALAGLKCKINFYYM